MALSKLRYPARLIEAVHHDHEHHWLGNVVTCCSYWHPYPTQLGPSVLRKLEAGFEHHWATASSELGNSYYVVYRHLCNLYQPPALAMHNMFKSLSTKLCVALMAHKAWAIGTIVISKGSAQVHEIRYSTRNLRVRLCRTRFSYASVNDQGYTRWGANITLLVKAREHSGQEKGRSLVGIAWWEVGISRYLLRHMERSFKSVYK